MELCCPLPSTCKQPESIIKEKGKLRILHDENCDCCCCVPSSTCYKYVQPEVPKSFAPIRHYWRSTTPMNNSTTYRLSYWECPTTITEAIRPQNWLITGDGEISDKTTYNASYLDYLCVKPVSPITPCEKQWLGRGPIQDVTTQKHDYTWKSLERVAPIKARNHLYCHPAPLLDDTTYKLSYYESCCPTPAVSYAPIHNYVKSDIPMAKHTVHKLSYWPHDATKSTEKPWEEKQEYSPPEEPIEGCTTYKLSYYPHSQCKPSPILPTTAENILNAQCFNDKNTTYRLSYFGRPDTKPDPIRQPDNITFSTCPPAYDTIHRMSFVGNWDPKPETPITPCSKQMLGRGMMQDVTTQKHDFTWKRTEMQSEIRPRNNLVCATSPVQCCTTHRMSFLPSDCKSLTPVQSYAPIRIYKRPEVPMNGETVMHLSYQPVDGADRTEKLPISETPIYQPPAVPLDGTTTYKTSYIPPGMLLPCCMAPPKPCQPAPEACC